ncbi:hypothetical protein CIPAW_06G055400 [Carya illinoinensis]|uniref:Endonuclease/exonuclease/phosphatase domain-containing protein n=1 Tax=Carya illinoinensis TaxID=32201 RepID=A0A8T1Q8A0_CARIL|nr:hypothetical protein CIPAW_06G055400 [Carya illinoinensis]
MHPKIISWNVQGLNECNKRLRIKALLRMWRGDVVCLQETKLRSIDRSIVRSLCGCSYVGWSYLASVGASGGVLLMWDKRVMEVLEECIGDFSVATMFKNVEDGWVWAFVGTYGPNVDRDRRRLWEELAGVYSLWDVPWCMEGDFNITRFQSECSGQYRNSVAMDEFSKFIFDLNLMDLPLVGGEYTWSNGLVWSKLDRFLVSPEWEAHFPEVCLKRLP